MNEQCNIDDSAEYILHNDQNAVELASVEGSEETNCQTLFERNFGNSVSCQADQILSDFASNDWNAVSDDHHVEDSAKSAALGLKASCSTGKTK